MMISFLENIRKSEKKTAPIWRKCAGTAMSMAAGIVLGVFSKYLDCTPSNHLPDLMERLDITNFLGRFAIWIFIAVCISVYSRSAFRAAVHVFVFFTGMVASYFLYSKYVAGFFPRSYALIWAGFTAISPILAFICWYAKGKGKIALTISAGIIAVLFNTTFAYGWGYFDVRSVLELAVFIMAAVVLRRTARETGVMMAVGIVLAVVLHTVSPYHFW